MVWAAKIPDMTGGDPLSGPRNSEPMNTMSVQKISVPDRRHGESHSGRKMYRAKQNDHVYCILEKLNNDATKIELKKNSP